MLKRLFMIEYNSIILLTIPYYFQCVLMNLNQILKRFSPIKAEAIHYQLELRHFFVVEPKIQPVWFIHCSLAFAHKSVLLTIGEYKKLVSYASLSYKTRVIREFQLVSYASFLFVIQELVSYVSLFPFLSYNISINFDLSSP